MTCSPTTGTAATRSRPRYGRCPASVDNEVIEAPAGDRARPAPALDRARPAIGVGPRSGPLAALRGLLERPLASYYVLLASVGLLLCIGLVMVFSATSVEAYAASGNAFSPVSKQLVSAAVGLVAFWICQRLPARSYRGMCRTALAICI